MPQKLSRFDAVVVLPNLAAGGAQRQGLFLAHELVGKGLSVAVFLTHSGETTESNSRLASSLSVIAPVAAKASGWVGSFGPGTRFLALAMRRPAFMISQRKAFISWLALLGTGLDVSTARLLRPYAKLSLAVRSLRPFMRGSMPSLAISFLPQSNIALLLARNPGTRCVVVERNDFERQPLGGVRTIQTQVYPSADTLMANSQSACAQLRKAFPDQVVRLLPNTYPDFENATLPRRFSKNIIVVGRLVPQKNPIESLRCFLRSGLRERGWVLSFVGGGELEGPLRAEAIRSKALGHSVQLLGEVPHESIPYDDAGFMLLNSNYEGAPNVLAEALQRGIIPIFRDTVAQAAEIVPLNLLGRLSFSSEEGLQETLAQLHAFERDFQEVSGRLAFYYRDQLRNHELVREKVLTELIDSTFPRGMT